MLKFSLHPEPSQPSWRWFGGRWRAGSSWIEPFQHPVLETVAATDGTSSFIAVRERDGATVQPTSDLTTLSPDNYVDLRCRILDEPTDHFLVERDELGEYHLFAGQWGNAPIYIAEGSEGLHGSWDFTDLRQHMGVDRLHELTLTRILSGRIRHAAHTIFEPIKQITARMSVTYSGSEGIRMTYPEPAMRAHPRPVREGVDIVRVYEDELARAVRLWDFDPERTAVELSGGMDSANVAMTLAALHPNDIRSYALIYGEEIGAQQARRRQEMIDFAGFRDFSMPALDRPPLHSDGARVNGVPLNPVDEPYHEAVAAMLDMAAQQGVTTVFTGDGGDELVSLRGTEWEETGKVPGRFNPNRTPPNWLGPRAQELLADIEVDLPPPGVINAATHIGFASRTPQFMRAGLWPLSPLCSPRLIRFAEQLPLEWRLSKRITRERLRRLGLSEDVQQPQLRENFTHVMERGLAVYGVPLIDKYLNDSLLVESGYVDADALRRSRDATNSGMIDTQLFGFLRVELCLRGLLR
ncbi:asparagine synthase C-terminal domain-containing protein [Saccharothrix sp. NPDC042600]|uniref:asparagine synthase C-terminal domain-containing protein n=1 Tax=Saccharothrix TaxID=2071 RepID=UPI003404D447|nr:asparagine synthase [Saccharothrix mutabilis subsp. capreolus]